MNKSKKNALSHDHRSKVKMNKNGSKKLGKPLKKHIPTDEEASMKRTKNKLLPPENLRFTKTNGFPAVKNSKSSNHQKLIGENEKSSAPLKSSQGTSRKDNKTAEMKNAAKQQKRKKSQITGTESRAKKKKRSTSESDSDVDNYIDKFFEDVSDGEPEEETKSPDPVPVTSEEEESSDMSESESIGDESEEENKGNVMSLEELVEFYGKHQDRATKKASKLSKKAEKASKVAQTSKSTQQNDWIEEDNDVDLVYNDSDEEKQSGCKMMVSVGNGRLEEHSDEEQEEEEDDDGWMSFEEEESDSDNDSYDVEGESELDDHEFSSDYDSDDSDDLNDPCSSYWDESYDSEDDEDYIGGDEDSLYISRGTAQIYDIDDNQVSFNSDVESAQIVEIPCDENRKRKQEENDNMAGCPKLVPIYDAEGNLIDSSEKLERSKYLEKTANENSNSLEQTPTVRKRPRPTKLEGIDPLPTFQNSTPLAKQNDGNNERMELDASADVKCRFYDSVDMRMSVLVLKETVYFSGHLTIQPLVGGLEVMGYYLKPGECRSVYAVRGFHSLNLSPHAGATPTSKEAIRKAMTRVEKHFQLLDLQDIQENFDPSSSVLVLLQADCSNNKIAVVDKYLSEEYLFPKVEFLKKSAFFTTEHLLNVEFHTEYVDKFTPLYQSDPEWDKIDVKKTSKIVVMGGKGSGKSTLCQYLINKNVSKFRRVVLIDLDIGQPIQHIPETISVTIVDKPLLGVATFSPIKPAKSWLFGSQSIVSSPIFYMKNVKELLCYCEQNQADLANVPWVINTMGYVTDFGEELMAVLLRMFSPTDVIQLVSTNKLLAIPNFQHRLTYEFISEYSFNILRNEVQEYLHRKATFKHHELNVCYPKKGFTLNAPKRRSLMLLAHLADILHDTSREWFNDVKPFCAPLSQLQVLITREDQPWTENQLPSVLNASLVYLCQKVNDGLYECLGIGIVRGVDKNNNVYLLQSLPAERLTKVNVLAICSSSLPNAVFLRQSTRIQGSIPYVYNID